MPEDGLSQAGRGESFERKTSRSASHHGPPAAGCVDDELLAAVNEAIVSQAFKSAVQDCKFCVTIASPKGQDYPLVAVSKEFETMTGYLRSEILGVNCRFLNQGVDMDPHDLMNLRIASQTGAPFTAVIPNRKKSGELFLNLLDVRGLTVARETRPSSAVLKLIEVIVWHVLFAEFRHVCLQGRWADVAVRAAGVPCLEARGSTGQPRQQTSHQEFERPQIAVDRPGQSVSVRQARARTSRGGRFRRFGCADVAEAPGCRAVTASAGGRLKFKTQAHLMPVDSCTDHP